MGGGGGVLILQDEDMGDSCTADLHDPGGNLRYWFYGR